MKKLYTRFFHIPKQEKIGEKVMLVRIATTIATIVVCLIAMSLTAYAYFSCDVTSVSNVIKAAKFDAQITVTDESGNRVEPSAKEGKISTFAFTVPGNYTVTLSPKEDNTAQTGFCVVYVGKDTYHTQQIGVDVLANNQKSVSFTLQVKGEETVRIKSHWGTSSYYDYAENECYIVNSDPLKVIVVGTATNSGTDTGEVTTTTTTTTTTETTTTLPETSVTQTTGTTEITQTTTFPQTTQTTKATAAATTETTTAATTETTTAATTETTTAATTEATTVATIETTTAATIETTTAATTETTTAFPTTNSVATTVFTETTTENGVTTEQTQPISETTAVDTGEPTA